MRETNTGARYRAEPTARSVPTVAFRDSGKAKDDKRSLAHARLSLLLPSSLVACRMQESLCPHMDNHVRLRTCSSSWLDVRRNKKRVSVLSCFCRGLPSLRPGRIVGSSSLLPSPPDLCSTRASTSLTMRNPMSFQSRRVFWFCIVLFS